jgi:hypothetical protein
MQSSHGSPIQALSSSGWPPASGATLLGILDPQVVLTLGDNQYENGTLAKFRRSY